MKLKLTLLSLAVFVVIGGTNAQQENKKEAPKQAPENWFNLDAKTDNIKGVSTEKSLCGAA
jgi:hypothetical protein